MKTGNDEATKLRHEISARSSRRGRLPRELRERCERYAAQRAAAGAGKSAIADELGVSATSVQRWLGEKQAAVMVPVRIVAPAGTSAKSERLVVVTAGGHRVEGLDLDGVCTLIARVG
jgi:Homeodomain-like domain